MIKNFMPEEAQNQPIAPPPLASSSAPADAVGLRVSLIPAEEMERQDPSRGFRRFLVTAIIFIVAVGLLTGYLGFLSYADQQTVAKLDDATAGLVQRSKDMESSVAGAKSAQARLKALTSILSVHKTGLKIFYFLEKHTLPDVAYSSVSVGESGAVSLTVSAGSFETYAAQVNELRAQPEIKSLTTSSITPTYDEKNNLTRVNFTMSLLFDPGIFLIQTPAK
jgi:hypothetical protein